MIIDERTAINLIGEECYFDCIAFFQEVFERQSDIKIIMTRRCFSLFKIFQPILKQKGIENNYGKIITDKALPLHYDEIVMCLNKDSNDSDSSILIVDDIIIYGRTINSIIDQIVENMDKDSTDSFTHDNFEEVIVRCLVENKYNSQIKKEYENMVLPQTYASKMDWKKASCQFSSIIKSANIANTSYIISYSTDFDGDSRLNDFLRYCDSNMVNNSTDELLEKNVSSYVMNISLNNKSLDVGRFIDSSCLRIYFYNNLKSVVVSPIVVLKDMNCEEMESICKYIFNALELSEVCKSTELLFTKQPQLYSVKIRFLCLILSHILLCGFLKNQDFIDYSLEKFDYEEIMNYNFSPSFTKEFHNIANNIYNFEASNIFNYLDKNNLNEECNIEQFLFHQAMLDNQAASAKKPKRLEGFCEIGDKSVFSPVYIASILSLIDNGKAALKSFYENGKFISRVYPGEQAFRIMNDRFKKYLDCFFSLERYSILHDIYSYNLYRDFVDFLLKNNLMDSQESSLLNSYVTILEETDQQISDVYVHNPNCEEKFIRDCLDEFIEKSVR